VHNDAVQVTARVRRLLTERLRPAIIAESAPCQVAAFEVAGDPVAVAQALAARYSPIAAGDAWGPPWSTTWLRVSGQVPGHWPPERAELAVDLGFDSRMPGFQAEGLAYDGGGAVVKGIAPRNSHVPLPLLGLKGGDELLVYVEAAANPSIMGGAESFAPTRLGLRETSGTAPGRRLGAIELVLADEDMRALCLDIEVLSDLAEVLPDSDPRRPEILAALDKVADRIDPDNLRASVSAARGEIAGVLAAPAHAGAHRVVATGHAHIDSAWLWPVRETIRKCARTFANVLALGEQYPQLVFACSQAQQYEWMRDHYPGLFARLRDRVAAGTWVPVGGTWVEPDGNLCGGEALARQLVLGRRFFLDEFGVECPEVWLPDSFGYSAAWPQLAKLAGARYFLTQKLSWNQVNAFPHSTFWWEGIDGTRIFTHFPPVATYNAELTPAELAQASSGYAEKGRGTCSLVPFGYGDGGGGPTREMLERAARQASLAGSPAVKLGSPADFFRAAEQEYAEPPVWSGELYLEIHRGTLTSQAHLKAGNRRCEHLLREAELWSATALALGLRDYPYDQIEQAWKTLLLLQFHDILPGSSIGWVNDEAAADYDELRARLEAIVTAATTALAGGGSGEIVFNASPRAHDGVPAHGTADAGASPHAAAPEVRVAQGQGDDPAATVLDNGLVRVVVDADGLLRSVRDLVAGREVVPEGGRANLLQLHRDLPARWDAWDIDASYRRNVADLTACDAIEVVVATGQEAVVQVRRSFGASGASRAVQRIRLRRGGRRVELETEVDWQESEKLLKVALPVDLRAEHSSAEIQYGHVRRPLHANTSWDAARFEVCAHRFVHVGEAGYGVAIANDATYGHDMSRTTRPDGGTTTTVRLSLVRGPRFPDPRADRGTHRFGYVLAPGADIAGAVGEGYRANLPLRRAPGSRCVPPIVAVDDGGTGAVIVEAVKAADNRTGDLVLRVYEALGGRARATVALGTAVTEVLETDLLERPVAGKPGVPLADGSFAVELRPFEIRTLLLRRAGPAATPSRRR
jgi:alpha-mannosidase